MKTQDQPANVIRELNAEESALIIGGGNFSSIFTSGGGTTLRTAALGLTIFGLARLMGAAIGYATA